jgi:hypothetical protein
VRLLLEAVKPKEDKRSSFASKSKSTLYLSSRKRLKAALTSSSKKNGNNKIEKQLALERQHRQVNKAELSHVFKLIKLHKCLAGIYKNNSLPCVKVGEKHIKVNAEDLKA